MAIDVRHKKTSLDEEAAIYEKRDETESEKSRWKKMDKKQKWTQFKTYYLGPLMVGILVLCVIGFFIYKDVITKKDIAFRCAIVNEVATEIPVNAFSDEFTKYMKLDPDKNLSSFHLYYTNTQLAQKVGASTASDLSQISSLIYASLLDGMIAGQDDFTTYHNNGFFVDLNEFLTEEEQKVIEPYLYIPEDEKNPQKHAYGVFLDKNERYNSIFQGGGGVVQKPIYGIITNTEHRDRGRYFLYYLFPELQQLGEPVTQKK
ncbi:MAG: hypothetical protein ACI4SQ_02745 [Eubacterium sp.]